jgi:hypothetical protein
MIATLYLYLSWGIVLASLAWIRTRKWSIACAILAWVGLPLAFSVPEYSPAYWLGLAFQAPSLVSVGLCAYFASPYRLPLRRPLALAVLASVAGWALLLDSFAVLPIQLYALGFEAGVAGAIFLAVLLLSLEPVTAIIALALVIFVLFRLPTGNAWDAVSDPLLWLFAQWQIVKYMKKRLQRPPNKHEQL